MATTPEQVAHVWRRLGFGPNAQDLSAGAAAGPQAVIADLLSRPQTGPSDWNFTTATDWTAQDTFLNQQLASMAWSANPLQERLAWTLQCLVVCGIDGTVYFPEVVAHVLRLRTGALGSYRQLLLDVTTMAGMLKYLTGYQNIKGHPNQNYARELMELFALGRVHPQTGATNYTETDIQEIARALTGWQYNWTTGASFFQASYHDTGSKTFLGSPRGNAGVPEVIAAVAAHPSWPYYVPKRVYRELVGFDPDPATLDGLAAAFGPTGDLNALVAAIAARPEFLSDAAIGCRVKSPVELVASAAKALGVHDLSSFQLSWQMRDMMGQQPFLPPNVSGWPSGPRWLHAGYLMTWCSLANAFVGSVRNVPGSPVQQLFAGANKTTAATVGAGLVGLASLQPSTTAALATYAGAGSWTIDRAAGVITLLLLSPDFIAN